MTSPPTPTVCPACGSAMGPFALRGISLDRCGACHGVFGDAGEVAALVGTPTDLPPAAAAGGATGHTCPRCGGPLEARRLPAAAGTAEACPGCRGLFLPATALAALDAAAHQARDLAAVERVRGFRTGAEVLAGVTETAQGGRRVGKLSAADKGRFLVRLDLALAGTSGLVLAGTALGAAAPWPWGTSGLLVTIGLVLGAGLVFLRRRPGVGLLLLVAWGVWLGVWLGGLVQILGVAHLPAWQFAVVGCVLAAAACTVACGAITPSLQGDAPARCGLWLVGTAFLLGAVTLVVGWSPLPAAATIATFSAGCGQFAVAHAIRFYTPRELVAAVAHVHVAFALLPVYAYLYADSAKLYWGRRAARHVLGDEFHWEEEGHALPEPQPLRLPGQDWTDRV